MDLVVAAGAVDVVDRTATEDRVAALTADRVLEALRVVAADRHTITQVDRHARARLTRIGDRVRTRPTVDDVQTVVRARMDRVVVAIAEHLIAGVGAAGQHVVARITVDRVRPGLTIDRVDPRPTIDHVVATGTGDRVVATSTVDLVDRTATEDRVRALAADRVLKALRVIGARRDAVAQPDRHAAGDRLTGVGQRVGARPAVHDVNAVVRATADRVVVAIAEHLIARVRAAGQHVVARITVDRVRPGLTIDRVDPRTAVDDVVAVVGGDRVVAAAAVDAVDRGTAEDRVAAVAADRVLEALGVVGPGQHAITQVDRHTEAGLARIGDRVRTRPTGDDVGQVVGAGMDLVVAAGAVDVVDRTATEDRVRAFAADRVLEALRVVGPRRDAVAQPDRHARTRLNRIGDRVGARPTVDDVQTVVRARMDRVVVAIAEHLIARVGAPGEDVVARITVDRVRPGLTIDRVDPRTAVDHVVATGTGDRVVATSTVDLVDRTATEDRVATLAADRVLEALRVIGPRSNEIAQTDRHARTRLTRIGDRVRTRPTVDDVQTVVRARMDRVVVAIAEHLIAGVRAAGQHVVARITVDRVRPGLTIDRVDPRTAVDDIVAVAGGDRVVATATVDAVDRGTADDRVAALAADRVLEPLRVIAPRRDAVAETDRHARTRLTRIRDRVRTRPTVDDVQTIVRARMDRVVVTIAEHLITGVGAAGQHVVARITVDRVRPGLTIDRVDPRPAVDHVVATGTGDRVVATSTVDLVDRTATEDRVRALAADRVLKALRVVAARRDAVTQPDRHARTRLTRIGDRVRTRPTVDDVQTVVRARMDRVVITIAEHLIAGVRAAGQHVVARITVDRVRPGLTIDRVDPRTTVDDVVAVVGGDRVVATAAVDAVDRTATEDRVATLAADRVLEPLRVVAADRHTITQTDRHTRTRLTRIGDRVRTRATVDDVQTVVRAGMDRVVVTIAEHLITGVRAAGQHVVARITVDRVNAGPTIDRVDPRPAVDHVVATGTGDRVVATSTVDLVDRTATEDRVATLAADRVLKALRVIAADRHTITQVDRHARTRLTRIGDRVRTRPTVDDVQTVVRARMDRVVVTIAEHLITGVRAPGQHVVARITVDRVRPGLTIDRVDPRPAIDDVVATGTGDRVAPTATVDLVDRTATEDRVAALAADRVLKALRVIGPRSNEIAQTDRHARTRLTRIGDRVRTRATVDDVQTVVRARMDRVVAARAVGHVDRAAAEDRVATLAADRLLEALRVVGARRHAVAEPDRHAAGARLAGVGQRVAARPAVDDVQAVVRATANRVVVGIAEHLIARVGAPGEDVVARITVDRVRAGLAIDRVDT